jgi:hypothetical protein
MIKLLSVTFACLWMALPVTSVSPQSARKEPNADQTIQARFTGTWRLASLEEPGADGRVHRSDCRGMLMYTADGDMSVQVMYRNAQSGTNASPVQYAPKEATKPRSAGMKSKTATASPLALRAQWSGR